MAERSSNIGFKRDREIAKLLTDMGMPAEAIPFSGAVWSRGQEDIKICTVDGRTFLVQVKSVGAINRLSVRYLDLSQLQNHTRDAGLDKSLFLLDYTKPVIHLASGKMELPEAEIWVALPLADFVKRFK